jgi:formate dehydrogenase subunit gamma
MSSGYRTIHLLNIFALLALVLTGNTDTLLHNNLVHIWLGFSWGAILLVYGANLLRTHAVRLFDGLRKPVSDQVSEASAVLQNYVLRRDFSLKVKHGMARHNVLASYASVLMIVSFAQLAVSGVWMVFLTSGSQLYRSLMQVHNLGVLLTIVFFVLHLFGVVQGQNRPLLRAVFTDGQVSRVWLREHMEKILKDS